MELKPYCENLYMGQYHFYCDKKFNEDILELESGSMVEVKGKTYQVVELSPIRSLKYPDIETGNINVIARQWAED